MTLTPDCPTCVQTHFRPTASGRYEVTVTATDDSGVSQSDTLVVSVNESAPPTVAVAGPTQATTDGRYSYQASLIAGDSPLSQVVWTRYGETVRTAHVYGDNATVNGTFSFENSGPTTVGVTVTDTAGQNATADHGLTVQNTTTLSTASRISSGGNWGSSSDSSGSVTSSSSTGGNGFYKEIERFSANDGTVFTFNFLNDDQVSSKKGTGNELSSDNGGMGMKRGLRLISRQQRFGS